MSAAVHRGVLQLARLLLQAGPRVRSDYNTAAYTCYLHVFRDVEGGTQFTRLTGTTVQTLTQKALVVAGRERTAVLAAAGAEVVLRAVPLALQRLSY